MDLQDLNEEPLIGKTNGKEANRGDNQMEGQVKIGRLAMRQEGGNWVAYYALSETMEGALFLGSIKRSMIMINPERKDAFMDLMRDCVSDIIEEETGIRPIWGGSKTAPEHERSGSA